MADVMLQQIFFKSLNSYVELELMLDLTWNVVVDMDGLLSMYNFLTLTLLPLFIAMVLITVQPLAILGDDQDHHGCVGALDVLKRETMQLKKLQLMLSLLKK